jgi:hypothetical protein
MTTAAWFHCYAGIAGDMALGALLDAGADLDEVRALLRRLPLGGWSLDTEPVLRGGIAATRAVVDADEQGVVRTYSHIAGLIEEARLPDRVCDRAQRVFRLLAEVEGRLHRRPPEQVHFHEVGGIDAIVDVVGTCGALEVLGVDDLWASAIATGTGIVRTSHGVLPNPAPAVVELLRGVPTYGVDMNVELTTPTGAALLAGLCRGFGPLPGLVVAASGFGAGSRDLPALPNATQVVIGEAVPDGARPGGQPIVLVEANLDDVPGEIVAHAVDALLAAGALDAWTVPIIMKKGRPALTISVLCHDSDAIVLRDLLAAETGTLGVRSTQLVRWPIARHSDEVDVAGYPVRVKRAAHRVKVEYDDAARVARLSGLPVREVISRAEAAARGDERDDEDEPPFPHRPSA